MKTMKFKPTTIQWSSRIHPDEREMVPARMQSYLQQETPNFIVEHRTLCKDGGYKWVLVRGQALWEQDGAPVRMVLQDISDRKQTEEALKNK